MDKDEHTIADWLRRYPDAVSEAVRGLTDPREAMRDMLPAALKVLREILDAEDEPAVRLAAARDVLDRHFGKAVVRTEVRGVPPPVIMVIDAPDPENEQPELRHVERRVIDVAP